VCVECGEYLALKKDGHYTNKENTASAPVYICDECDQAYAVIDGVLRIAPYDASMNPISEECKTCGKVERFRQKCVYLINDMMIFECYCMDCGVEALRNWLRTRRGSKPVDFVTRDNVQEISDLHHFEVSQEIMSDPVKLKKVMTSDVYKKVFGKLGVDVDKIKDE
jgi:hypothetical protein